MRITIKRSGEARPENTSAAPTRSSLSVDLSPPVSRARTEGEAKTTDEPTPGRLERAFGSDHDPEQMYTGSLSTASDTVQRAAMSPTEGGDETARIHDAAKLGTSGAGGILPHLDRIQKAFGRYDVSGIVAHTDASAVRGAMAMGASAFTAGDHVAFASEPGLHTAAHEATHVIQQRAGVVLPGGVGASGDRYEQCADLVADAVVVGQSAEPLLDQHVAPHAVSSTVQRKESAAPLDPEKALVVKLIQQGQRNENGLSNAVFFSRHPGMEGKPLVTGSALAREWLAIRDGIVRPALAAPPPAAEPGIVERGLAAASSAVHAVTGAASSVAHAVSSAPSTIFNLAERAYHTATDWVSPESTYPQQLRNETGKGPDGGQQGGQGRQGEQTQQPPGALRPAYFSQRDNTFSGSIGAKIGVSADTECNVTTLAMQLVTVAGSIETVNKRTIELLNANGAGVKEADLIKKQPEDLILQLFQRLGDDYWKKVSEDKKNQPPFWKGFYAQFKGGAYGWHQLALCLNYIGAQYTGFIGGVTHYEKADATTEKYYKDSLKPELEKGSAIMLSTLLTGGHIVLLAGVENDGIRINDPYGMNMGVKSKYIANGSKPYVSYFEQYKDDIAERVKHNSALQVIVADKDKREKEIQNNWGENNFYPWQKVAALSIGKWNNVLQKK